MAILQITSCDTVSTYEVNYSGITPTVGEVFYFTFTGGTPSGCYTYDALGTTPIDEVESKVLYTSCI